MHLRMLNIVLQTAAIGIVFIGVSAIYFNWEANQMQRSSHTSVDSDLVLPESTAKADPSVIEGKNIWNENACGNCHMKSMKEDGTGPALSGVTNRWADYPREDLYRWIRGSYAMAQSGHPRAEKLFNDWKVLMQNYPNLTDEEIENLLSYIESR